jgi:RNA polymerase sigma-70 factor (ECF subfamily)
VLITAYYDEIYIYTCRQLGDKQEAMDITQEIFIAVWRSISGFNEKKAGFRTWLYRIATNRIIDYRRKNRPETVPLDDITESMFNFAFDDALFVREVETYISTLAPQTSRILRLHIYGGYSFPEIAEILKQPESKIKSQYYRAIKLIRKEFADYE